MRISVAMTTRNGEQYLEALLESLVRQRRPPDELVVHDDASEDSTLSILEAFASAAPFVVRIERSRVRRGHVAGFLLAAELCEGDAIAFCDQDDVWLNSKLEICARALERPGTSLALHSVRVVDEQLRDIAPTWPQIATRLVPPLGLTGLDFNCPGMALVFRRSLLAAADPEVRPPSRYGHRQMLHDEWVFFLAGVLGSIQLIAEPLALYRQHADNTAGWFQRPRGRTLVPAIDDYRNAAELSAACARFLDETHPSDPLLAERIAAGAHHFRRLARNWEFRSSLYEATSRGTRARLAGRLLVSRAYGARTAGGFGRVALGKDLVAGIALKARPRAHDDES